ncbi:MAG: glutamate-1-semialdehyde 2,1-aminomutase [Lautropia sp.]|nr:glutamate-1-semialdehyde 2,1-aminomutase [Lautropia sp.]
MSQSTNQQEFDRAQKVLVGGVNSAVRAFRLVGGTPRFIERAEGASMWDVEGKRYIDYVGSWGPAIVGHAHPKVVAAVQEAASRGLSFGAPNVYETVLAERICAMFPQVERVRFTSSGTESTMSALRLARGYTGRNRIIKFEGCYHGTADSLLVKAGSGALTFGNPSSAGVPADVVKHTLIARYNDLDSVRALFEQYPDDVACLIVEPIPGNMNLMVPNPGFLQGLRELCTQYGALLIFDEVMSGFRVTLTGAQGWCGVTPDLSTFGKVIGGGMPVGAVGGPAKIMERYAPLGDVYQAGTLSGNPIAMAAGIATMELISEPGFFEALNRTMGRLVDGLNAAARKSGVPFIARALGGLGGMYFRATPPGNFEQATDQNLEAYKRFFHLMMDGGVYLPPSHVEAFFLSSAHTGADIDQTIAVAEQSFAAVAGR